MLKLFVSAIFFCLLSFAGYSQLIQNLHTIYDPVFYDDNTDTSVVMTPFGLIKGGVSYGLQFGTGYSTFGRGVGMSNSYLSPSISYSPNQKLQVVGGLTLSLNSYNGVDNYVGKISEHQLTSQSPTQVWAYAQYNLNKKLSFYALGSVEQNQSYFSVYSNSFGMYDSKMLSLGLNYKVTEKTSIGVRFNYGDTNSPFNGLGRSYGFGNPYRW